MKHAFWLLVAIAVLAIPAASSAQVTPRAFPGGVVGIDSAGAEVWRIEHASAAVEDDEARHPIIGPVEFGGHWYYALRGDVLKLDVAAGKVVKRTQYPASIVALTPSKPGLVVRLDESDWPDDVEVAPVHVHGRRLTRGPWSMQAVVALRTTSDVPDVIRNEEKIAAHKGDWGAVREQLRSLQKRDPTNPLLPAYRGVAAHYDEDETAMAAAFDGAMAVESTWEEDLSLCGIFERVGQIERADAACDRGAQKMAERGIRSEALTSLVTMVIVTRELRAAMEAAVSAEDLDAVDRIARRFDRFFPVAEANHYAWRGLAAWFEQKEAETRAAHWRARAAESRNSVWGRAFWGQARVMDIAMLFLFAIFLMVPVAGFAAGLRVHDDPPAEGWRGWLPRLRVAEVGLAAALVLVTVPLTHVSMKATILIGAFAEAPMGLLSDGYGSPDVVQWLDYSIAPGPEHAELLEYARAELTAVQQGQELTAEPPDIETVVGAIEHHASLVATDQLADFDFDPDVITAGPSPTRFPNPLPLGIPGLIAYFVAALAATALRRMTADKVAGVFQLVIPGSATFAAPIVLVSFLAGVVALTTPLGTILQTIAVPSFGRYYGLEEIGVEVSELLVPFDQVAPWYLLGAALVVHGATLLWVRRRDQGTTESS